MRILSRLSRTSTRRRGLTLVEILVTTVIFSILATSLFIVFKASLDSWRRAQAHLEVYQTARAAIDMMTRELSAAYLNSSNSAITFRGFAAGAPGAWLPSGANNTGSAVFFIAALNPALNYNDAVSDLCKVGYYLDDSTHQLMKYFYYVRSGSSPIYAFSDTTNVTYTKIADNITGFTLQYLDAAATPATTTTWDSADATAPTQLNMKPAKVVITLTIQEPNSTRTQTFTTGVYISN